MTSGRSAPLVCVQVSVRTIDEKSMKFPSSIVSVLLAGAIVAGCASDEESLSTTTSGVTSTFQTGVSGYSGTTDGYISGYIPADTNRSTSFTDTTIPVWH